jgi:endonuclease-3
MGQNAKGKGRWSKVLTHVTDKLKVAYGLPKLENYADPVKEIFFIVLSARTAEHSYVRAMNLLLEKYPSYQQLASANVVEILECIADAGLGGKRSDHVKLIANRLVDDFGDKAVEELNAMLPYALFQYLTSLPGLGPKSAFCVMMWSFGIDVLPVDVNVQRIAARMGVIPLGLKHYQAQQQLPKFIPDGRSLELHTVFMVHGRRVCTPRKPKCTECIIKDNCNLGKLVNRIGNE